jgi:hypothetical protein
VTTNLPIHPTLVHPVTGQPLRAVFVSEKTGRVYWPILGGDETGAGAGGDGGAGRPGTDGGAGAGAGAGDGGAGRPGTDGTKPINEMTADERADYFSRKSDRLADQLKKFGKVTPEQLAELQAKAKRQDELELELGTTAEKAAAKARQEAEAAARAQTQPVIVQAKLETAAARAGVSEEDLAAALEFIDSGRFVAEDGSVDTDRVKKFVDTIKPGRGNQQQQQQGPTVHGHGKGLQPQGAAGREKGLAEAQRRFGKKTA